MPAWRITGDRRFLVLVGGAALLLVLLALLLSVGGGARNTGYPSSYSRASDGALAAYLLLQGLGLQVERWEQPPEELPQVSSGMVLILAEPRVAPSAEERNTIKQFVARGGTVLATGTLAASLLPGGLAENLPEPLEWVNLAPAAPSRVSRGAREIRMEPRSYWTGTAPGAVHVYRHDGNPMVVTYTHGAGRVVWWAAPTPLANAGISASDNLRLFVNSVGLSESPRVFWDEYFHGVRRSLWSYAKTTPAPWALLQLLFLVLCVLATYSRRHGPVRPPVVESRLHPLEFVETMGALYHQAKATPSVVAVIYQRFRHRLIRRLGLPVSIRAAELYQATRERLGVDLPNMKETLAWAERAASGGPLKDPEAMLITQRLQEYADQLQLNPIHPKRPS